MNIKTARERAGLTQSELASMIGVTQGEVSRIEGGRRGISVYRLKSIAMALGMDPADMLDAVQDNERAA